MYVYAILQLDFQLPISNSFVLLVWCHKQNHESYDRVTQSH